MVERVFAEFPMARVAGQSAQGPKTQELACWPDEPGRNPGADAFRQAILADAAAQAFTGPANSLKYEQYLAAMRAYYYPPVAQRFPDFFSPEKRVTLQAWFAAVNRRVRTPESDGLRGCHAPVAQGSVHKPGNWGRGGPCSHGTGLADPGLAAQNQAYLDQSNWGWGALPQHGRRLHLPARMDDQRPLLAQAGARWTRSNAVWPSAGYAGPAHGRRALLQLSVLEPRPVPIWGPSNSMTQNLCGWRARIFPPATRILGH